MFYFRDVKNVFFNDISKYVLARYTPALALKTFELLTL